MLILTLYTRQGCHLCDIMHAEVTAFLAEQAPQGSVQVAPVDIDTDAALKERYDWRVPVLVAAGDIICEGRFDVAALQDFLDISGI